MIDPKEVADHYHSGHLLNRIADGCAALLLVPPIAPDALAPVDEFHIGGRLATEPFVGAMKLSEGSRVLDLGSGLGGPARYVAAKTGATVIGIDLTQEFVEVAKTLTDWTGLSGKVGFIQGSVLELPFDADTMDAAYMIHVGMNIADKAGITREAARVLKPGGSFSIYDIMQVGEGEMDYPAPWATSSAQSSLASPEAYQVALEAEGFEVTGKINRSAFAKQFFADLAAAQSKADGPPPLGLHLVMGEDTALKVQNMVKNVKTGVIASVEIHAKLRT